MKEQVRAEYIRMLFWHILHRPEAVAFTLGDEQLTFGALYQQARWYAAGLRALTGVRRGDRVMCRMQTGFEMIVALVGHYLLGVIHVPVNTRYGVVETAHMLEDSGAEVWIVDDEAGLEMWPELVACGATSTLRHLVVSGDVAGPNTALEFSQLVARGQQVQGDLLPTPEHLDDEQIALCIYTSGTTGKSKGVMLSYRAVVAGIDALTTLWKFSTRDRVILALPLFHVHGLGIGVHGTLLKGSVGVLHERFSPEVVVQSFALDKATVFMGVPTMYTRLLKHAEENQEAARTLSHARLFTSGSAALSADVFRRFEQVTSHRILERYGMSETLLTISNPFEPSERKPGTIGFPIASCEARIVNERGELCEPGDVGEIVVRGDSLMSGYWRNEEATRAAMTSDGWFLTGDAARYDEQGYVVHVGRRSVDILKVGGYKISAREIEEVLMTHPAIAEVAVVGVADEEWGQVIVAALVHEDGEKSGLESKDVLGAFLDGRLAKFKWPRHIVELSELPRNALGKVQKHLIEVK